MNPILESLKDGPYRTMYWQIEPNKRAGCWQICGDLHIYVREKPNILNRFVARLLLGWKWIDEPNT